MSGMWVNVTASGPIVSDFTTTQGLGSPLVVDQSTSYVYYMNSTGAIVPITVAVSASVANAVTFNDSGAGVASGTTFNGSVAQTISTNTIGAVKATLLAATSGSSLVGYADPGTGSVSTTIQAIIRGQWTLAEAFGCSSSASAAVNSAAINAATAAVGLRGGGYVLLPRGTIALTDTNPGAANWDNHRAIYIRHDNVHLIGQGVGATILQLEANADCHVIKFGSRETSVVTVENCSVSNLTIDGNRANQTAPTDTDDHWQGIDISSGCSRINLQNLHIHDTQYYGIGAQKTNIRFCIVENVLIENTGADGIDWKNDDADGHGNIIQNVTVVNCGLATGLTLQQAAFDLRSGVTANNLLAYDLTAEANLVGLRVQIDANSTEATFPTYPTSCSNFTLIGSDGASSYGIRIAARNTRLDNFIVRDFNQGIRCSAPDCKFSNFDVYENADGVFLTAGSTMEADTCEFVNGHIRSNTASGIILDSVDECCFTNVDVRGNLLGYDIRAGTTAARFIAGSCLGNTTNLSDLGTSTIIRNVSGIKTYNVVKASVAIDSTGTKTSVIAHGMGVTPSIDDIKLGLNRITNTVWAMGFLVVVGADATNISVQLNVETASATGGATVEVVATIDSKNR